MASVRPGRPCRATIGPTEMIVGGPPLISQLGDMRWTGTDGANGTVLERDGVRVARLYPSADPAAGAVFDPEGVALLRVQAASDRATVTDATNRPVRALVRTGTTIKLDHPALVVTGTSDLVLASVLSAPELQPEVRMLAACERVLVTEPSGKKEL